MTLTVDSINVECTINYLSLLLLQWNDEGRRECYNGPIRQWKDKVGCNVYCSCRNLYGAE